MFGQRAGPRPKAHNAGRPTRDTRGPTGQAPAALPADRLDAPGPAAQPRAGTPFFHGLLFVAFYLDTGHTLAL